MVNYRQKWKRLVLMILISIIAGTGITIGVSGIHYYRAAENRGKYKIDSEQISEKKIITEKKEVKKTVVIKIPRQYVNKFTFEYTSADFSNLH